MVLSARVDHYFFISGSIWLARDIMLCALSGQVPSEPVVSPRSGCIFERPIIEAYIREKHEDPISGEPLDLNDLILIKPQLGPGASRTPELASIPALLKALQSEYTGLVLESYTLRKQLQETEIRLAEERERNDASLRVIARLQTMNSGRKHDILPIQTDSNSSEVEKPVEDVPVLDEPAFPSAFSRDDLVTLKQALHKERKQLNAKAKQTAWAIASSQILKARWVVSHEDKILKINGNGSVQLDERRVSAGRTAALKGDWAGSTWLYWTKTQLVWGDILKLRMDGIQDIRWHASNILIVLRNSEIFAVLSDGQIINLNLSAKAMEVHPDGEYIIYSDGKRVKFWSSIDNEHKLDLDIKDVSQIRASPNGYLVALATPSNVSIIDLRKDDPPKVYDISGNITWHDSGRLFVVASRAKSEIWAMEAGGPLQKLWQGPGAHNAAFLGLGENVQVLLASS